MRVAFVNAEGREVTISKDDDPIDAIKAWCDDHGVRVPYTRMWKDGELGCTVVDFGSHIEFFRVYEPERSEDSAYE